MNDATLPLGNPLTHSTASDAVDGPGTVNNAETNLPDDYVHYVVPEKASIFSVKLNDVPLTSAFTWLHKGWQDFMCCPKTGVFYGLCFFFMGHFLWAVLHNFVAGRIKRYQSVC